VLAFDAAVGVVFLVAALLITAGRVFIGAHYPGDISVSLIVALVASFAVVRFARPLAARLVGLVERATDPVLRRVYPKRPVT
jgi:membrane-associated phospholipid phosphatase